MNSFNSNIRGSPSDKSHHPFTPKTEEKKSSDDKSAEPLGEVGIEKLSKLSDSLGNLKKSGGTLRDSFKKKGVEPQKIEDKENVHTSVFHESIEDSTHIRKKTRKRG